MAAEGLLLQKSAGNGTRFTRHGIFMVLPSDVLDLVELFDEFDSSEESKELIWVSRTTSKVYEVTLI